MTKDDWIILICLLTSALTVIKSQTDPVSLIGEGDGDVIIGGFFDLSHSGYKRVGNTRRYVQRCNSYINQAAVERLEAFVFAIEEINKRNDILPGITIGNH